MVNSKEALRENLEKHRIVRRLLENPNWEPAARAAVAYFIDGKNCPVKSWVKSSTWQQVKMAFEEVEVKSVDQSNLGGEIL
jgi:hypothetical protein